MSERERLYRGLSRAAWGYLFLYLDINLGTVSILPRFAGWLLFLSAIRELREERRDLALLRPLGIMLAAWSALDWGVSWLGRDIDGLFPPLDLLLAAAQLYFLFQFLTDLAALAEARLPEPDGGDLSRRMLRWRTVQTVLVTVFSLAACLPEAGRLVKAAVVVLAAAYCVLGICLMAAIFALRRYFKEENPADPA